MKKIAILDMNAGVPNQGLQCIREIVQTFEKTEGDNQVTFEIFDVRAKGEIPSSDFDIYISSGGPGSPFDGDGKWDVQYYNLIQELWDWNLTNDSKKYVFFICHSFQMAVIHFEIAEITERKSKSFGVYPVHKTAAGIKESLFKPLNNPFYAADFRDWQVIQPDNERLESLGAKVLALEKIRPHVDLERAIMAVRFSEEFFGVQFHPEADVEGMRIHFSKEELRNMILTTHGKRKYQRIFEGLNYPNRLELTHNSLLPKFIQLALNSVQKTATVN